MMNLFRIISAEYERGLGREEFATDTSDEYLEIAVFGRSNVGKSSYINRITGRKSLARVSSQPGHTRSFNSYLLTLRTEQGDLKFRFVDLPGFGYAKFSKEKRSELSQDIVTYIQARPALRMVLLLMDIRREPESDEMAIQQLCYDNERIFQVVLTKTDKVSKRVTAERRSAIAAQFGLDASDLLLTALKMTPEDSLERIYHGLANISEK